MAEAARNLSCVGAEPIAITDNLNFGSPENSIGYWQLALACQGIAEACKELETPVTGGNVSLYNETLDSQGNPQAIYPTPVIGMVGLVPDITRTCGQGWQNEGDRIYLLGFPNPQSPTLGGSEYLATIHGTIAGLPPRIDFELERKVQAACRYGIRQGWIKSAHDCAEGGLAVALAECCISGNFGAEIALSPPQNGQRFDELLFGEGGNQILVAIASEFCRVWEEYLQEVLANLWQAIGIVARPEGNLRISWGDRSRAIDVKICNIKENWSRAIERRLTDT